MGNIDRTIALVLIGIIAISCLSLLTVKPLNAQSTAIPEFTILYPTNGTLFNVSRGVDNFQLKYATNSPPLSWIGYSIDGDQNRTAYGEWFSFAQILYDDEGNPRVRVSGVFESDGNHNLTLYANNTSGDWAVPQTVTYLVNLNSDTFIPPTTSKPTTTQPASLSPTLTLSPTKAPDLDQTIYLIPISVTAIVIILAVPIFKSHRKTTNL